MRYLMLFFLPVMALFLQSTLFGVYSIKNTLPDLLLVFVIFYALLSDARNAAKYGFFCGLLEDLLLGRFIGMNALSKGLTAYIIGVLQGSVFNENLAVGMLSVLLGTLLNYFFVYPQLDGDGDDRSPPSAFCHPVLSWPYLICYWLRPYMYGITIL